MFVVGYLFHGVTNLFTHGSRKRNAEVLFQNVVDAAFTGLAVDTDHIGIISSSYILWIDRQIWNAPLFQIFVLTPLHTFGNSILMGTGKSGEHQISGIWLARCHNHAGVCFITLTDLRHIGEVQFWIHAVGEHVHSQCDDVHITGSFTVSK